MRLVMLLAASLACAADYANLDDLRVHYQSIGQGKEAVVFIHGWTCDLTFWSRQTPAAAELKRVLLVDLPGHGLSDKPEIAYTIDLFARGVEAALRAAKVERAVLVGHSMGVPVARQVIRRWPEKVIGFVAVDGRFRKKPTDPKELEKQQNQFAGLVQSFRRFDYRETLHNAVTAMLAPAAQSLHKEVYGKMSATPQHVMVSALEDIGDWRYGEPDPIRVPVLAIFARANTTPEQEQLARSFIPNLDYQVWDGVGHFLMMEQPERFSRVLIEFLKKL